jgi:hypothetical protein
MALSAAERAKKYREDLKNNPTKYNNYLKQEKQRYRGRKERGNFDIKKKSSREQKRMKRKGEIKKEMNENKSKKNLRQLSGNEKSTTIA